MIKVVSFDIGGTLVTRELCPSLIEQLIKVVGEDAELVKKMYKKHFVENKISLAKFEEILHITKPEEIEKIITGHYHDRGMPQVYPDVIKTLTRIKKTNRLIIAISNKSYRNPQTLTTYGLNSYFDAEIYSHNIGYSKPDKHIFQYAQSAVGVHANEIVHVGDSVNADIEGAISVNWHAVLLDRKSEIERANARKCKYVIRELDSLINIIEKMSSKERIS